MAPSTASLRGEVRQLLRPYYIVNIILCLSFIVLKEGDTSPQHLTDLS